MNSNKQEDLEVLQQARPYLRSALAFLLYMRFGTNAHIGPDACYSTADIFLTQLEADVRSGD